MLKKNRMLVIVTTLIILLPIIAGLILWNRLPAEIPSHWDIHGNVDKYNSKAFAVFGFPLILAAIHWIGIFAVNHDPRNANNNKKLLTLVMFICPVISILISAVSYAAALGHELSVDTFMPIFLGLLFIVIGNYMPKARRNHTVGIRIPWTLKSDVNWERTHRFAGPVLVIGGIAIIALAFTGSIVPIVILILVTTFLPIVYSWLYHVKHKK